MMPSDLARAQTAALTLGSMGLPCFPCAGSKKPTCPHGHLDATRDPQGIRDLWARYPGPLTGVRTGAESGFDVLDVDPKHPEAVDWCRSHPARLPRTRVHTTRSGGIHVLLRHAVGLRCSNSRIARGIDVRADGGYIIWWPATGLPLMLDAPLADWPEWLLELLMPASQPMVPRVVVADSHALSQIVRRLARAHEGERNAIAFWAACRAGEMVASRLLDAESATAIIAEAATLAGLPYSEAERTARSGIRKTGGLARA
jgi:Bifunctional DNA primase/polymerase, N-terminal